jgi:hypothetical protein
VVGCQLTPTGKFIYDRIIRSRSERISVHTVRRLGTRFLAAISLTFAWLLSAQQPPGTSPSPKQTSAPVPFVGCQSDGQTGYLKAPNGKARELPINSESARQLAYYSSSKGFGALAPRGWFCFATYGSGGEHLYVSPDPIDSKMLFSDKWGGLRGPGVQLDYRYGGTSGRFVVAEIIARVFPAYKAFAVTVMKELTPPDRFSFSPYPDDRLTYKSKTVVEYTTPAHSEGLGTHSALKKNDAPIDGAVMLVEHTPDLMQVAVRMPPGLEELAPSIIPLLAMGGAERLPCLAHPLLSWPSVVTLIRPACRP